MRLAKEIDGIGKVFANDISKEAHRFIKHNMEINDLQTRVEVKNEDANLLLSRHAAPKKRFNCIDLDPFGSPIPYLDSALRALRRGGLLALTATDMAPLCGVHSKSCLRKYGGKPLRTEYCHELAVRLLAGASAMSAAKYDFGINVVFSYSLKHYTRLYCKTNYGAKKADNCLQSIGYIHHCFACFHRAVVPGIVHLGKITCPECGEKMCVAGPLWIGKIVDEDFVESMEREAKTRVFRLKRKVDQLLDLAEREANAPITYYVIDRICDNFELPVPSINKVVGELTKTGHQACLTHFNTRGIRTDASAKRVKESIISCLN
jgi:tRNA (guanine26-N2/guanine27-N2)-dimethyltransferase